MDTRADDTKRNLESRCVQNSLSVLRQAGLGRATGAGSQSGPKSISKITYYDMYMYIQYTLYIYLYMYRIPRISLVGIHAGVP